MKKQIIPGIVSFFFIALLAGCVSTTSTQPAAADSGILTQISGKVLEENGTAIRLNDPAIWIFKPPHPGPFRSYPVSADGKYKVVELPDGEYDLTVTDAPHTGAQELYMLPFPAYKITIKNGRCAEGASFDFKLIPLK